MTALRRIVLPPMNRCGGCAANIDAGNALADRAAAQLAPPTPTETRLPAKSATNWPSSSSPEGQHH
jgi:hypothetical protein